MFYLGPQSVLIGSTTHPPASPASAAVLLIELCEV